MKKVRKAIIPAAGLGTRFLPATKAMPKEMLPIVDTPTIQLIVEEALNSGIEEILVITGKHKRAIEDHFDSNAELEDNLKAKNKNDLLEIVNETSRINLHYIRQKSPEGLGHAVLQAKAFVGDEPFVVMLGDDLMVDDVPLTKQLIEDYNRTSSSVVAVMEVPHKETNKYGVIDPVKEVSDNLYEVQGFVEKPEPKDAPSNLAIIGRYLLTPEIFGLLETQTRGAGNEIQLTDAINRLNKKQTVYAHQFTGTRYDTGDKFGYMQTNIEFGLKHPQIKDQLHDYLFELVDQLRKEEGK